MIPDYSLDSFCLKQTSGEVTFRHCRQSVEATFHFRGVSDIRNVKIWRKFFHLVFRKSDFVGASWNDGRRSADRTFGRTRNGSCRYLTWRRTKCCARRRPESGESRYFLNMKLKFYYSNKNGSSFGARII
jgi:hypothetical protein